MSETNPPAQDRVGNDYNEGSNPTPGGDIDLSDRTLPPYEGRTQSTGDIPHEDEAPDTGVATDGATGPVESSGMKSTPAQETPGGATASPADEQPASEQAETRDSDPGVGPAHTSGTQRGEDVLDDEGTEAGREQTGTKGASDRPTGESDARDQTAMDPQEGNTDRTAG